MTEYDYSPEAMDRYQAKLRSIGRWVHDTERYEPTNPFALSPAPRVAKLSDSDASFSRHRPHRSYTAPPKGSSSSTAHNSSSSQGQYLQQATQIYAQPQQYANYPQPAYPYPIPPPIPARQYGPPQRSHTYAIPPPPPPPPPPRPLQPPKRSHTIGGYGSSPQMVYDPRVGASRAIFPMHGVRVLRLLRVPLVLPVVGTAEARALITATATATGMSNETVDATSDDQNPIHDLPANIINTGAVVCKTDYNSSVPNFFIELHRHRV
ncbi:hypothetical protein F5050DRAFT_1896547 [Lentinula boryana]|uniref:Uncharacterized protein n=1 Tax=Lentinula boryana TaxID=40481 RepID=A0ABQ8Q7J2_9AGAR|nr:hypothetical protein F5050DRAFT_1896547 [Lentinula boryana]